MWLYIDDTGLVMSYGNDEFPGATFFDISSLPDSWESKFALRKLGYDGTKFFDYEVLQEDQVEE